MNIKNSSYYKFFKYTFVISSFIIIIIGILMTLFSVNIYKNEKLLNIKTVGDLFISNVKTNYALDGSIYSQNITDIHKNFIDNYGVNIFLYDEYGNCVLSADSQNYLPLSKELINEYENEFLDFDAKTLSSNKPSILYGKKFHVKHGDNTPSVFYVSVLGNTDTINSFTIKLLLFFSILAASAIYFIYFFMRKNIIKYALCETEFVRVSQKYSKGDFTEKINMNLTGNIYEAAKYVNALALNMKNSDEKSKTFVANVSHELRTPMTTIGGFVDGILDGTIPKSRQQEYLYLVSKEIKRLKILISSMLNMTRFESGTLLPNFCETNITDLVIQTIFMFEKKINDKGVEIEGLDSERLVADIDPDLIQQVIYNLIENAVKFVNNNGTISFAFEKNNNICSVSIRNTGDGLKNNEIEQIFDRFYKADSSRGKDTTGLGLGLSIAKRIVHIHNGRIIVKSVSGQYTEFSVELPEKQN